MAAALLLLLGALAARPGFAADVPAAAEKVLGAMETELRRNFRPPDIAEPHFVRFSPDRAS